MKQMMPSKEIFAILGGLDGDVGLYVEDTETGETLTVNPGRVFPSASVIKLPLLSLLLADGRDGRVDLERPLVVAPQNRVGGTGILRELPENLPLPLSALAKLMVVLSDNVATNTIIDVVGMERVDEHCREHGLCDTSLQRKMMDFDAIAKGRNNFTTAGDIGKMLSALARGEWITPEISFTILDYMAGQQLRGKLPALLPASPVEVPMKDRPTPPPGRVCVAHKTGDLDRIQHDVGVFILPDGRCYVIAMLTGNLSDDRAGIAAIGEVSLAIYRALSQN
ncbi:MAG: class A beta-lactamase-related serine hydrolase [Synergistaceae bacterium]|jgi:beta-lactamase class A|nr:class A beta-lactamase-related serine hydrolase [Synergistaceae bacterium]